MCFILCPDLNWGDEILAIEEFDLSIVQIGRAIIQNCQLVCVLVIVRKDQLHFKVPRVVPTTREHLESSECLCRFFESRCGDDWIEVDPGLGICGYRDFDYLLVSMFNRRVFCQINRPRCFPKWSLKLAVGPSSNRKNLFCRIHLAGSGR